MVEDLVITEKMDGENTTIHNGGTFARSPDSRYHPSRDWLKAFAASISPQSARRSWQEPNTDFERQKSAQTSQNKVRTVFDVNLWQNDYIVP